MVTTGGDVWAPSIGPFGGLQDALTSPGYGGVSMASNAGQRADGVAITPTAQPVPYLAYIGIFFLALVGLKFLQDHEKLGIEGKNIAINAHNLIVGTLLVSAGVILEKTLINKYLANLKPVADLVNMV